MPCVTLRPATADDAARVWAWRNDPDTRAASLSTGTVPLADHQAWFKRALADPDRTLLIGMTDEGEPVGLVRLDTTPTGERLISISIAPERRGTGLGAALLKGAMADGGPFVAEVRADNARSIRLFEGCGFTRRSESGEVVTFEKRT